MSKFSPVTQHTDDDGTRCGHSGLGSVTSVSRGTPGPGLLMAAGPCQAAPEPASTSGNGAGVTILPVTAENLAKLDNSRDIDLSFPITSTYLRQMRHRPEAATAGGAEPDEEDDEVGHSAILYQTKSDRNRTLTSGSEYRSTSHSQSQRLALLWHNTRLSAPAHLSSAMLRNRRPLYSLRDTFLFGGIF